MKQKSNFNKFLLLWFGELVSSIGSGLTAFGLGVYIFKVTGSAASMALVTLLGFLPSLLLSVPAGILADRYDRRLLMMIGDGFSALGVLFILICMIRGEASLLQSKRPRFARRKLEIPVFTPDCRISSYNKRRKIIADH